MDADKSRSMNFEKSCFRWEPASKPARLGWREQRRAGSPGRPCQPPPRPPVHRGDAGAPGHLLHGAAQPPGHPGHGASGSPILEIKGHPFHLCLALPSPAEKFTREQQIDTSDPADWWSDVSNTGAELGLVVWKNICHRLQLINILFTSITIICIVIFPMITYSQARVSPRNLHCSSK